MPNRRHRAMRLDCPVCPDHAVTVPITDIRIWRNPGPQTTWIWVWTCPNCRCVVPRHYHDPETAAAGFGLLETLGVQSTTLTEAPLPITTSAAGDQSLPPVALPSEDPVAGPGWWPMDELDAIQTWLDSPDCDPVAEARRFLDGGGR